MQQAFALIEQNNLMFYSLAAAILVLVILISLAIYLDTLGARSKASPIRDYFHKPTDNPGTLCGIIRHIAANSLISTYGGSDIGKNIPHKVLYRKCG